MKIVAMADLHGHLPTIPPCDLLLLAGDICPAMNHSVGFQEYWLDRPFRAWLQTVPATHIIGIWGNHDFIGEKAPERVPDLSWTLLQDSGCVVEGLKIWGSPWQREFNNWAFNLSEAQLAEKWALIPPDTDILVVHSPPYGWQDEVLPNDHLGSPSLLARLRVVQPKLTVWGHIHEAAGKIERASWGLCGNVGLLDGQYRLVHQPREIDL